MSPTLSSDERLTTEPTGRIVGVDGAAGGWFAVWQADDELHHALYSHVDDLLSDHDDATRLLVDIPIGLASSASRGCDSRAREMLGSRGVSVFPTPCRAVVDYRQQADTAASYDRANEIQREHLGAGLSRQAWNITPKIAAMDDALPERSLGTDVSESHPECCFAALNRGYPIAHPKSSPVGRAARFGVLDRWTNGWQPCYETALADYYRNEVARDDIVDAMILAVAGRQPLRSLPAEPPVDDRGLPMQIVVPDVSPEWTQYTDLAER